VAFTLLGAMPLKIGIRKENKAHSGDITLFFFLCRNWGCQIEKNKVQNGRRTG
jgi:hypothetical protein